MLIGAGDVCIWLLWQLNAACFVVWFYIFRSKRFDCLIVSKEGLGPVSLGVTVPLSVKIVGESRYLCACVFRC